MPKFSYQAINETGATVSGELEAESLESANSMLASRGYIPTRVRVEQPALSGFQMTKIRELLAPIKAIAGHMFADCAARIEPGIHGERTAVPLQVLA